jgi:hypothetical protein
MTVLIIIVCIAMASVFAELFQLKSWAAYLLGSALTYTIICAFTVAMWLTKRRR